MEDERTVEVQLPQLKNHALTDPLVIIATGFGIGWIPLAPGTIASLAVVGLFWFFMPADVLYQYATVFGLFLLARLVLEFLGRKYGSDDASCIVLDEFLGMAIALFLVPKEWWLYLIAFVIFRILDIVKPWPISWIEKKIKGPYGIILDDVAAGLGAVAITQLIWLTQG